MNHDRRRGFGVEVRNASVDLNATGPARLADNIEALHHTDQSLRRGVTSQYALGNQTDRWEVVRQALSPSFHFGRPEGKKRKSATEVDQECKRLKLDPSKESDRHKAVRSLEKSRINSIRLRREEDANTLGEDGAPATDWRLMTYDRLCTENKA
jgi:hypothetical protein